MNRRHFLQDISRWLMAGGLIGTSGWLLYRRKDATREVCSISPVCGQCNLYAGCNRTARVKRTEHGKP